MTPFGGQAQIKAFATYPLPWNFMVSGVFQNISGPTITANYAATNSQIAPSLGRDLAACRGAAVCNSTAVVPLIVPQTMYDDRLTRLDLRLAKRIGLSQRMRLQANVNVYNVFNGSASSTLKPITGPCGCSRRCCRTAAWSSSAPTDVLRQRTRGLAVRPLVPRPLRSRYSVWTFLGPRALRPLTDREGHGLARREDP